MVAGRYLGMYPWLRPYSPSRLVHGGGGVCSGWSVRQQRRIRPGQRSKYAVQSGCWCGGIGSSVGGKLNHNNERYSHNTAITTPATGGFVTGRAGNNSNCWNVVTSLVQRPANGLPACLHVIVPPLGYGPVRCPRLAGILR